MDRPAAPSSPARLDTGQVLPRLMREQLRLSIRCAASFLILLLGLPLLNYFWPELMARPFFGFTLSWLLLGILFFPFVWLISWIFIRRSTQLEREEVADATRSGTLPAETSAAPAPAAPDPRPKGARTSSSAATPPRQND